MKNINTARPKSNQFWRDTSVCQISGHSSHVFWRKGQETSNFTSFTKSKWWVPKWGKSTDRDWNLISSEDGHDTATCQNSGHSSHAFSRNGNPKFDQFQVKMMPKRINFTKYDHNLSSLKVIRIQPHAKLQDIPSMLLPENTQKPHI